MEKYLKEGESLKRLLKDYRDFGTLIVAVDFDDTLFDFCGEGYNCDKVKSLLQDLDAIGCEIAIWTANQDVEFVEQYLKDNNIPFNCINEECPTSEKWLEGKEYRPRKIFAHAYLDDRAGLRQVYGELCEFIEEVKLREIYIVGFDEY